MSLESALRQPGPLVGAWDYQNDGTLRIYSVGRDGAKLIECVEVADDEREDTNQKLVAHAARIGATHSDAFGNAKYVWAMDDRASIWSERHQIFEFVPNIGFRGVRTFFDVGDPGHRGVKAEWSAGGDLLVVEEHDPAARADPSYNADNLSVDLEWAFYLGRDLGGWRGVPHYDQLTDTVTNAEHLMVREAAHALAERLEGLPDLGDFEYIYQSAGAVGKASDLTLRVAPNPLETHRRFVEVRVTSPSGKTTSGGWVKQGSNKDIEAFLRRVQTPSTVLRAMNALRAQQQDGYA